MGSMSIGHWLVVLAVIVLLFGAKKLPELAKGVGKSIKTFKAEMEEPEANSAKENEQCVDAKNEQDTKNT